MLKGRSEACPTHVALWAAGIRWNKVPQQIHWDYFILPRCTTLLCQKAVSSPTLLQEQNRKKRYNTCHKPGQQARSHGTHNLTWIMNNNTVQFEFAFDAHQISSGSCEHDKPDWMGIQCASRCPCERILKYCALTILLPMKSQIMNAGTLPLIFITGRGRAWCQAIQK